MNKKKKQYQRPSFNVVQLQEMKLICESGGLDEEAGSRQTNGSWDSE